MDNYFDLHFHPLAKNHLAHRYGKQSGKEDLTYLTEAITMSKPFKDYTEETVLRTLESQSCIDYLKTGNVHIGVAAIAALEFGVASSEGFFADILKSNLTKPFDESYFEAVKDGEISYLNLFLREVEHYLLAKDNDAINGLRGENIHILKGQKPNLIFAIEGGHNLSKKKIGNALEYDEFKHFEESKFFDPSKLNSNDPSLVLAELVKKFREKGMEVLYLTLAHLTHIPEQHLATHAFGSKAMKHPSFYPFGHGLTELGKKVIDMAYTLPKTDMVEEGDSKKDKAGSAKGKSSQDDNGPSQEGEKDAQKVTKIAPIFIDITHMSLKSRQDFYEHRELKGYGPDLPIIASHVGVTGYSINEWKDNLDTKKCLNHTDQGIKTVKIHTRPKVAGYWGTNDRKEFTYHPGTINLMDEDIIEVVKSKGIIGVGLDMAILGNETSGTLEADTYEFITTADFMAHFPYSSLQSLEYASTEEIRTEEAWSGPENKSLHPLSFCFNIVHLLAVIGLKANEKRPQDFICLGSDFDGFIEPIKICGDSRHLKDLEAILLKWLPVAAKRYQKEHGGTRDLFEFTKKKKTLKEVVRGMLYENGWQFLGSHYPRERSGKKDDSNIEPISI